MINKRTINNKRQNKPTYVAQDLEKIGVPRDITYHSLLKRGVFKWMAARKDIITLKKTIKDRIRDANEWITSAKKNGDDPKTIAFMRGNLRALQDCQMEIRRICHSSRWRAPQNDNGAIDYLDRLDEMDC